MAARPLYQPPAVPDLPPAPANPGLESRCRGFLERLGQWAEAQGLQVSLQLVAGFPALAAALPGRVFVDAQRAETLSEGALGFVLAHELGHLAHHDHAAEAGREQALALLTEGLEPFDLDAFARLEPVLEASQALEREQEREADRFAGRALRALGYEPRSVAREALETLYQDREATSTLERTHGTLQERLASLDGL